MSTSQGFHAWLVTGPLGHLWSAVADIVVLWTRYLWRRYAAPRLWRSS